MSSPSQNRPNGGTRRQRGAAVRERVVRAATELMAERGYSGTTISAISKASGVLPASIYWHFDSKEGLLGAVIERAADAWFAGANQAADEADADPQGRNHAGFRYIFEESPAFPRVLLLISLERREAGGPPLEAVKRVRDHFRERLIERLQDRLADLPDLERRRNVAERLAALALVLIDGSFIGHQIDDASDEVAVQARYDQIGWAMGLARDALLAEARASESDEGAAA